MCSRYYLDENFYAELETLLMTLGARQLQPLSIHPMDIRPSMPAPVIYEEAGDPVFAFLKWGFQNRRDSGLVINARVETVTEKAMFREAVTMRRCLIPASGFYEWDAGKNKFRFTNQNGELVCFAGIFTIQENEGRFVILTTAANTTMEGVHDRMPLILQLKEYKRWLADPHAFPAIQRSVPPELTKECEMEQLRLDL